MYILVVLRRNNCVLFESGGKRINFKINVLLQNRNNINIRSSETITPNIPTCTTMFIIHDGSYTWSRSY